MTKSNLSSSTDLNSVLKLLEENLELYLEKKAPAIPSNWKEFLVKAAPYFAILGVILMIPSILAILGLGGLVIPFGAIGGGLIGRPFLGINYLINLLFLIVMAVFEALAIPGLFSRSKKGWQYLYYSALISGLHNIVFFNLGGLLIGTLLSLYVLFQVKEYYK